MKLELGLKYGVLKSNGSIIIFRFIGNLDNSQMVYGEVDGEPVPLTEIFSNYINWWLHKD